MTLNLPYRYMYMQLEDGTILCWTDRPYIIEKLGLALLDYRFEQDSQPGDFLNIEALDRSLIEGSEGVMGYEVELLITLNNTKRAGSHDNAYDEYLIYVVLTEDELHILHSGIPSRKIYCAIEYQDIIGSPKVCAIQIIDGQWVDDMA